MQPLVGMDLAGLREALGPGQPAFRARQIYEAIYRQQASDPIQISTLPLEMRRDLAGRHPIGLPGVANVYQSVDGTRRYLLSKFPPDPTVEEVLERKQARRDALRFWREAIANLQTVGVIAPGAAGYRELGPPLPRRNWADQWLDEPLEIHPGPATRDDFLGMAKTAKAKRIAAARKAAKARKEGK